MTWRSADRASRSDRIDPRARRWASGRLLLALGLLVLVAVAAYVGYAAYEGSRLLVLPDDVSGDCTTPAEMGWDYEAINYDQATDIRLVAENRGHLDSCTDQGSAGAEVAARDGTPLAGWYIPAAGGVDPRAPTVLIVHGHSDNKSVMLPYADALHERYNVVLMDLRASGRSGGTQHTLGVLEQYDVEAMLDWLVATKNPEHIAVLALSGGAAASLALARADDRIDAFITDSLHARSELFIRAEAEKEPYPSYPTMWATLLGFWIRTGHDIRSVDPIDSLSYIRDRPLLLIHGTADQTDRPAESADLLYAEAQRLGMDVTLQYCEGAGHAEVIDTCTGTYPRWVGEFLARAFP